MRDRDGMDSDWTPPELSTRTLQNEIAQLRAEKRLALLQLYRRHVDEGKARYHDGLDGYIKVWDKRYGVSD